MGKCSIFICPREVQKTSNWRSMRERADQHGFARLSRFHLECKFKYSRSIRLNNSKLEVSLLILHTERSRLAFPIQRAVAIVD